MKIRLVTLSMFILFCLENIFLRNLDTTILLASGIIMLSLWEISNEIKISSALHMAMKDKKFSEYIEREMKNDKVMKDDK